MIHIAICDDAPQELKNISLRIKKYIASNDLDAEVEEFSHPDALLLASEKTPFDLYLLDIIMPMITGIDVGRELRNRPRSLSTLLPAMSLPWTPLPCGRCTI